MISWWWLILANASFGIGLFLVWLPFHYVKYWWDRRRVNRPREGF